jgi:hypothetical protein
VSQALHIALQAARIIAWTLAGALVLGCVMAVMPGLFPVLLVVACWWAQPMTWESEFDHWSRTLLNTPPGLRRRDDR